MQQGAKQQGVKQQTTFAFDEDLTLDEKFRLYHEANPDIYTEFRRLARLLRSKGHSRYGAKGLFEALRFHYAVDGRPSGDEFKLNNNFTSRYVRMLIEEDPSFDGFFELRQLKSREENLP